MASHWAGSVLVDGSQVRPGREDGGERERRKVRGRARRKEQRRPGIGAGAGDRAREELGLTRERAGGGRKGDRAGEEKKR